MKLAIKKTSGAAKPGKAEITSNEAKKENTVKGAAVKGVEVAVEKKKNYVKLSVSGDVTIRTVSSLKKTVKELTDEKFINMVFDLSNTRYVDSSGLGFFIGTLKTLKEAHGALHISGLNDHIKGLFQLINLTNIFEIFEDSKEAAKF